MDYGVSSKHAETILKKCHLDDVRKVFYPLPCPQVSAFDHTPRLCGRPLWTAPRPIARASNLLRSKWQF